MFRDNSLRAGRVLMLARLKAGERGADAIEPEDLLVGFIIEDQGNLVKEFFGPQKPLSGTDEAAHQPHPPFLPADLAGDLLTRLQALPTQSQPVPKESDLPTSDSVQRIFTLAASLRDELKQRQIEPLNLLAAILQEGTIRAAGIARAAGVTRGEVLRAINKEAVEGRKRPAATDPFTASPSWGRTTLVLALAKLQAWSRGAPSVATEDILAALVIEDQAVVGGEIPEIHQYPDLLARLSARAHTPFFTPDIAARLLTGLAAFQGVLAEESARESRNRCVGIASPELLLQPPPPYALVPMSEGTSRVFHLAANLRAEIQPLHLLAAIMEDESNCCTRLVREVGITREKVVQHLREAI